MKTLYSPRTGRGLFALIRQAGRWLPALLLALALLPLMPTPVALADNPAPQQLYYVTLPEDDLLQLFDDNDHAGGTFADPVSPIRSITSISIGSTGTWIYYDQWEDGGYDANIANPGANTYANPGNPDGTQIWGDGILANGCPPSINNVPNQCLFAADDLLQAGDVIILDNNVIVGGTSGSYTRNPALIFFDGRDKFGVTFPVAVTRAAFPLSPGSVMAGGTEVLDTGRWGTSYLSPLGEDTPAPTTRTFEDVRWFVMAGAGGATINVDANGDGDYTDATKGDLNNVALSEGQRIAVTSILEGASLTSDNRVQVNSLTADIGDTFEFRWDALLPRPTWSSDYYTPVGTAPAATTQSGCTEVWAYNPSPTNNVRDEFTTRVYTNNHGSQNWVNAWDETGDDDSPTAGNILINTSGQLEFSGAGAAANDEIRRSVNLSGAGSATLRFQVNGANLDATDDIAVEASANGTTWTTLETLDASELTNSPGNGQSAPNPWAFSFYRSYDLAAFVGQSNVRIRFRLANPLESGNAWYFDDVDVRYGATLTINYDFPGGSSPDGSMSVRAGSTARSPIVNTNNGAHFYSSDSVFLPISITDCTRDTSNTEGRLYDWGNPLFPVENLTTQVLVPWAPGCSNESFLGVCRDAGLSGTRDVTTDGSRSVVWVTPLANTTIWVDYDGSGVSCPSGAGAETSINPANALVSYRLSNNPTSRAYVRHGFGSGNYTGTDNIGQDWPQTSSTWATDWLESGESNGPTAGAFRVVTSQLRIGAADGTANETGWTIRRGVNLSNQTYANLRFQLRRGATALTAADRLAVDVTSNGTTWFRLGIFQGDQIGTAFDTIAATAFYNISPYISANTAIRFVILNDITSTTAFWFVDNVHIDYAVGGDWDMTGARMVTCDGTKIAAAYGQDPQLSGGNDEEALDLGTGIAPFGSAIAIDKSADKTVVAQGGLVNYSFAVTNQGSVNLMNVSVTDNRCSPAVYVSGDNNPADGMLNPFPAETWTFTCSSNIYFDTTNVAYAEGNDGSSDIVSAPDEWTVTVIPPAVIGNYVWLDEDGDGDQDAGEAGIPNVQVTLTGTDNLGNPVNFTTYTDANGGYLFDGLPPSNGSGYTITIVPPAGLHNTYDEDTGTASPNNTTTVILAAGDEHLTADFGLNWAPSPSTNNPPSNATGAIGDRVWIDADGDGAQDLGEAGLGGVTVTLYHDPDGDGVYDTVYATTTTDAAGNYIFDNLPAGGYVVEVTPPAGYDQTGDPDQFGAPCTACDNRTTSPVVLGPGDVFVNADFGYEPTGASGSIGDTVWLDADRDNTQDANENGIPGVTVALIRDLNGNGQWDVGEPIIATDITDEIGQYLFSGLPIDNGTGTDDYLVWVNDTNNVLGELAPTYDVRDGANQGNPASGVVTGLEISAVTNLDGTPVTNADFAYAPPGHDPGEGLIGDTIWLDRDGGGDYDPGEGLEGVRVTLTDPGPDGILGTSDDTTRDTFTDENGNYYFGGLEPSLSYRVTVDTATLPPGVTNTIDPDGTTDSTTVRNLAVTGPIDLGADFAYRDTSNPNTIAGTLWEDRNANGTLEAGETLRFPGVTVVLYNAAGDIVATTTTDSNGNYNFTGLPDGTYTVDVTDDNNVLFGYWKSNGPNAGQDNNSQVDPYTVSVAGGQTNTTGDFGYYLDPAAVGNFIWDDLDGDGIQDAGEPGIPGVVVGLTITWPNNDVTTLYTVTDAFGYYSFDNLLLDEDYNASNPPTPGQPNFEISVDTTQPALYGFTTTLLNQGNGANDSDNPAGVDAVVAQGAVNDDYDFGFRRPSSIGNKVWIDENGNGIQDPGEPGIANVEVTLTITWPDNTTTVVKTVTDATGWYSFGNLLLDEDYNGDGSGPEPVHVISIDLTQTALSGLYVTEINATGSTPHNDSNDPDGATAQPVQGQTNTSFANDSVDIASFDFGFSTTPLAVLLASFAATAQPDHVLVAWETVSEIDNAGFNLYRSLSADGERTLLAALPSAAPGSTQGAAYSVQDADVLSGQTYWYFLEDIDLSGAATLHGPVSVLFQAPTAVTLSAISAASPAPLDPAWLAAVAGLAAASGAALRLRWRSRQR